MLVFEVSGVIPHSRFRNRQLELLDIIQLFGIRGPDGVIEHRSNHDEALHHVLVIVLGQEHAKTGLKVATTALSLNADFSFVNSKFVGISVEMLDKAM